MVSGSKGLFPVNAVTMLMLLGFTDWSIAKYCCEYVALAPQTLPLKNDHKDCVRMLMNLSLLTHNDGIC